MPRIVSNPMNMMARSKPKNRFSIRRTIILFGLIGLMLMMGWFIWQPGLELHDGRHDLGRNGIWLQHGWLGDDDWFARNQKADRADEFRNSARLTKLADDLRSNHIIDVFPHLCPCDHEGNLAGWDSGQLERFLDAFSGFRVMPWIGGVHRVHTRPESAAWRARFIEQVNRLLTEHPRLAGVQINIEPMPSGTASLLTLLDELRVALPPDKLISVAAYPPPTRWHPVPDVHWEEDYFRDVAARCDQMAVMLYDTALKSPKVYRHLMKEWTREALLWSGRTPVLLGVPAYEDADSGYHDPKTEDLENALAGIHAGLASLTELPVNYQGIAIYSEWEMKPADWLFWKSDFLRP